MSDASAVAELSIVVGPTAAGKSAIALWLAAQHPITIISADSRQVYRRFDAGTAKPTVEERKQAPHRGIDIVEPTDRYSADRWRQDATEWIEESRRAERIPLIVGGTGLYVRALIDGLFEQPPMDLARREQLRKELDGLSVRELRRWVERLDPARAHLGRVQLTRAIETALLSGRRLSDLQRATRPGRWRARYLVVDPRLGLGARIVTRVEQMIAAGWAAEVRALMNGVAEDAPAWKATGYSIMRRFVAGEIGRDEAKESIVIETRQYAKRQRTWFRNQLSPARTTWVDPNAEDWQTTVTGWWRRRDQST